jgi:cell division protein FtsW
MAVYNKGLARRIDYPLIITLASLLLIGLMMICSSSFDFGYTELGKQPTYFFGKQITWVLVGTAALIVMMNIEYHTWRRFSIPIMAGTLFLLVLVLFVGSKRLGAVSFLYEGSIQPSELCKLTLVIYIADWLSSKGEKIRMVTYGLIPFAILIGVVAGLIVMQPDFGTAIIIVITAVTMFFIAGADILQLAIGLAVGGPTFALLILRSGHALKRIKEYLDAFRGAQFSYHIQQNLLAILTGRIFGVGLGNGTHKLGTLPLAHSDSIFAVLAEELGLIGCLLLIGLFAALAYRGFKIALEAPDDFGTLLGAGITCWLIFQALVNIAVTTNVMPLTGLPLPFISYGGSSLVVSMAGVGLLLSISKSAGENESEEITHFDFGRRNGRPRISNTRRH